eukprot:g1119.t1
MEDGGQCTRKRGGGTKRTEEEEENDSKTMEMMQKMERDVNVRGMIDIMETHKEVLFVHKEGLRILRIFARDAKNREIIGSSNGVQVVVRAMETFKDNAKVQEEGCCALGNIAANNAKNREIIGSSNGVQVVFRALMTFKDNAKVRRCSCFALRKLASHGVQVVVRAMETCKDNAEVQEYGCLALGSLARNNAKNKEIIGSSNGVQLVVRAMETCKDNAEAQRYGCLALGNLASNNAKNSEIIGSSNGVQVVVRAMETCKDNAKVQEYGCYALGNLASNNAKNSEIIGSSNGVQLVVRAMETFKDNAKVQDNGCFALGNLASNNAKNSEIIGSSNGVQVVVRAMETCKDNAKVQDSGCFALGNLASNNAENHKRASQLGGVALINACKAKFKSNSGVQQWAEYALKKLRATSPKRKHRSNRRETWKASDSKPEKSYSSAPSKEEDKDSSSSSSRKERVVSGAVHVKLLRSFRDGLLDKEFYKWEDNVRNEIAKSLGIEDPTRIEITAMHRADRDHLKSAARATTSLEEEEEEDDEMSSFGHHELTADHLEQMRAMFDMMEDKDENGCVNVRAFIKSLKSHPKIAKYLHLPLRKSGSSDHTLASRFQAMDIDGSKTVDFEKFVTYFGMSDEDYERFERHIEEHRDRYGIRYMTPTQESIVRELFLRLDGERNGYVDKSTFDAHYHRGSALEEENTQVLLFEELTHDNEHVTMDEFLYYFDGLAASDDSGAFDSAVRNFQGRTKAVTRY